MFREVFRRMFEPYRIERNSLSYKEQAIRVFGRTAVFEEKSGRLDSNQRPLDPQSSTLNQTELRPENTWSQLSHIYHTIYTVSGSSVKDLTLAPSVHSGRQGRSGLVLLHVPALAQKNRLYRLC